MSFSLAPIVYEFAMAHLEGLGTAKSPRKAFRHMKQAAKAGNVQAMLQIAHYCESGIGKSKNLRTAFYWWKKAADLGSAEAMYHTAISYGTARGTDEDPLEFHRWAQNAVREGHNKAFMALGLAELHIKGLITPRKISNALNQFDRLGQEVQQIKSDHALARNEATEGIAHFTTLETLHSMLPSLSEPPHASQLGKSHFLRLYNLSYVNDPQEGKILLLGTDDESKRIQEFFGSFSAVHGGTDDQPLSETLPLPGLAFSVYVGSFTLRSDRLDLWRAYGQDGTGFCIVTPFESFLQETGTFEQAFAGLAGSKTKDYDISMALYRVEYDSARIASTRSRLNQHLQEISNTRVRLEKEAKEKKIVRDQFDTTVRAILSDILYLYKHEEYKNEEEVRMLAPFAISAMPVSADERSPARLYVRTKPFLFAPGSKIIIGPKVRDHEAVRLELRHRLDRNGHTDVDVLLSSIQYR